MIAARIGLISASRCLSLWSFRDARVKDTPLGVVLFAAYSARLAWSQTRQEQALLCQVQSLPPVVHARWGHRAPEVVISSARRNVIEGPPDCRPTSFPSVYA